MRRALGLVTMVLAVVVFAGTAWASPATDDDVVRLESEIMRLEADPALAQAGGLERLLARQAIAALAKARSKDRPSALRMAQWRVETARLVAEAAPLAEQSRALDQERDAILVEASRRDAERARREVELLRLQALAREEEAERNAISARRQQEKAAVDTANANQEADQARQLAEARALEAELARKEAELAAQVFGDDPAPGIGKDPLNGKDALLDKQSRAGKTVHVLDGSAFASGKAALSPAAREALGKLAAQLKRQKGKIRIDGFTDNQGKLAANQALSLQRALAVRTALMRWGVAASRLQANGRGEAAPVASNATAEGRARNRRVEITVE